MRDESEITGAQGRGGAIAFSVVHSEESDSERGYEWDEWAACGFKWLLSG